MWWWRKKGVTKGKMQVSTDGLTIKLSTVVDPVLHEHLDKHIMDIERIVHRALRDFNGSDKCKLNFDDADRVSKTVIGLLDMRSRLLDMQVWSSTRVER